MKPAAEGSETRQWGLFDKQNISFDWMGLLFRASLIFALTLWIYGPALHGTWIGDDVWYITGNPLIHDSDRIWKAWFVPGSWVEYYPLQETVQWVQWQLWGEDTLGYHLTNIVLHIVSALLIWYLLSKFDLSLAWLGGLIFAVHPVVVESVASIVELKNTLSLPPFLIAMCLYLHYDECRRPAWLCWSVVFFTIAMLCKISMIAFPLVLLLYAWWKRGRISQADLAASLPFFVVSVVLGATTIWAGSVYEHHGAPSADNIPLGGLLSRIALAGLTLSFYFSLCFWPVFLLPIYPQWTVAPPSLLEFLPWPILGILFYVCWLRRNEWGRHLILGLGFFLIFLSPFLGFISVSYMKYTWVMDHLLYIPLIGLIGLVVAGMGHISEQLSLLPRLLGGVALSVVVAVLALLSYRHAALFLNAETLWSYAVKENPQAWSAHNNLANVLSEKGQFSEAADHLEQAARIKPTEAEVHYNLGNALRDSNRLVEAVGEYQKALQIAPRDFNTHNNLALVFKKLGRVSEASAQFAAAAEIHPNDANIRNSLGISLSQMGRAEEAKKQFTESVRVDPNYRDAHFNLGLVMMRAGYTAEAIAQFEQVLRLDPKNASAQGLLAELRAHGKNQAH